MGQAPVPGTFHAFFLAMYARAAARHPALPANAPSVPRSRRPSARPPGMSRSAIIVQLTDWFEFGMRKADNYLPCVTTSHRGYA